MLNNGLYKVIENEPKYVTMHKRIEPRAPDPYTNIDDLSKDINTFQHEEYYNDKFNSITRGDRIGKVCQHKNHYNEKNMVDLNKYNSSDFIVKCRRNYSTNQYDINKSRTRKSYLELLNSYQNCEYKNINFNHNLPKIEKNTVFVKTPERTINKIETQNDIIKQTINENKYGISKSANKNNESLPKRKRSIGVDKKFKRFFRRSLPLIEHH